MKVSELIDLIKLYDENRNLEVIMEMFSLKDEKFSEELIVKIKEKVDMAMINKVSIIGDTIILCGEKLKSIE